jgi:hypothetical protein
MCIRRKILANAVGILAVAAVVGLGRFYIASRTPKTSNAVPGASRRTDAEKLLQQLAQQKKQGSANAGTAAGGAAPTADDDLPPMFNLLAKSTAPSASSLPSWRPAPAGLLLAPASRVPLRADLTVITSVNQPMLGDYESIKPL